MNKKYIFASVILGLGIITLAKAVGSDVQYPVKELGNCVSGTACKNYCDKPANTEACLGYAEKTGLMSAEEVDKAEKFLEAGSGPGGCKTMDACESYCNSVSHIDECVDFAEKNGLMSGADLEEAKKIKAAKDRGVKMPACGSKKQCDVYCSEPDHMEECITFAQEAGFMSGQELEDSRKMLAAIKAGVKPPPCKGKAECDVYCMQEENFNSCLDFALAAGMMDSKDAEMARKTKGKGPGGCRGKEQCDSFCQQEGNMETCAQFAYENGMMTKEEFEMMKKTKGKGPGGCKSKEECENFCNNPDNQETCFNFSKENGLMSEEDIKRIKQGKQQFKESMQNLPSEVYSCMESAVGTEKMAKFKSGEAMPPKEIGDSMRVCFEQNIKPREPGGPGEGGNMPPAGGGNTPMPGTSPAPCEGENCPPPPPGPQGGGSGPGAPCSGENCPASGGEQYRPGQEPMQPTQPGTRLPMEGSNQPPQGEAPTQPPPSPPAGGSTAPGSGGGMTPGVFVPQIETAPSATPIEQTPAPAAPPSSSLQDFLGLIISPWKIILSGD